MENKNNQTTSKDDKLGIPDAEKYYASLVDGEEDYKDRDVMEGCPICSGNQN